MLPVGVKKRGLDAVVVIKRFRSRRVSSVSQLIPETPPSLLKKQIYDYFLVLDFEATCERRDSFLSYEKEIIEFPVYKVDSRNFKTLSIFHSFVKPTVNPTLTSFCSRLTGISQETVDNKPVLKEVLEHFDDWMNEEVLQPKKSFIFVTSGDWDLSSMLPRECKIKNLKLPSYFHPYINVNKSFAYTIGMWPRMGRGRLPAMLKLLDLEVLGEMHQGTSDCENMIRVMEALAEKGYVFQPTSKNKPTLKEDIFSIT